MIFKSVDFDEKNQVVERHNKNGDPFYTFSGYEKVGYGDNRKDVYYNFTANAFYKGRLALCTEGSSAECSGVITGYKVDDKGRLALYIQLTALNVTKTPVWQGGERNEFGESGTGESGYSDYESDDEDDEIPF